MAEADESINILVGAEVKGVTDIDKMAKGLDKLGRSTKGAESVYRSLGKLSGLKINIGSQVNALASGLKKLNSYSPNTAALESVKGTVKDLSDTLGECAVKVGPQINGLASGLKNLNEFSANKASLEEAKNAINDFSASIAGKSSNIGSELKNIAQAMQDLKGVRVPEKRFQALGNVVSTLADTLNGKSISISSDVKRLAEGLTALNAYQPNETALSSVSTDVSKLADELGEKSVRVGSQVKNLMAALDSIGAYSPATHGLITVIKTVNVLSNALGEKSLKIASDVKRLVSGLNELNGFEANDAAIDAVINTVTRLADALEGKSIAVAKDVASIVRSVSKLQTLNATEATGAGAASAVNGLVSGLSGTDASGVANSFRKATTASKSYGDAAGKASTGVRRLTEAENDVSMGALSFTQRLGELYNSLHKIASVYFVVSTLQSMFESLAQAIMTPLEAAAEYQEQMNLMTVSLGQYAEQAYQYAQKVQECLGINAGEYLSNQGTFMTLVHGMGVASDAANTMSENLTRLSYDLGSFFNLDYSESFEKVRSAISGETESIKQLGYDLSETRLQQIAYANGIETSVSEMSQADKAYLRYIALMQQVSWAQGDLTRTIASPANQMKILAQQAQVAARAVGNAFLPALQAILPIAIAVVKVIATLANKIAEAFGGKGVYSIDFGSGGELSDAAGDAADNLGDVGDAADDTGGSASDAADKVKELKRELMGFDEINKFSSQDDSSSSGSSPSGGSGSGGSGDGGGSSISGIELPTDEWEFDDSFADEWVKKIEDFLNRLWEVIKPTVDLISGYLDQIKKQWDEVDVLGAFADAFVGAVDLVSSAVGAMARVLGPVLVAFNIPATLEAAFDFVAQLFTTLADIVEQVGIVLGTFSEAVLAPIAAAMGEAVRAALRTMTDALKGLSDWMASHGDETRTIIAGICGAIAGFMTYESVTSIIGKLKDAFEAFGTIVQPAMAYGVDAFRIALNQAGNEFPSIDSAITKSSGFLTKLYEVMTNGSANAERFKDGMRGAFEVLSSSLSTSFETLAPHLSAALSEVYSVLKQLKDNVAAVFSAMKDAIASAFSAILSTSKNIFSDILSNSSGLVSNLVQRFSAAFPAISSVFQRIGSAVGTAFSGITASAKIVGITLTSCIPIGVIVAAIAAIVAAVAWWVTQTDDGKKAWSEFGDTVSRIVSEFKSTVGAAFANVVESLKPVISKLGEVISTIGKLALSNLAGLIKFVAEVITLVATALAKVIEFFSPIINFLGKLALDVLAGVINGVAGAIEGIGNVLGPVVSAIGDWISKTLGVEEANAETIDSIEDTSDALSEHEQKVQDNIDAINDYDDANGTLQRTLQSTGMSVEDLAKYLADTDQTVDDFVKSVEDYADSVINSFDKIDTESQISLDDMVGNLRSNIQTTQQWSQNLEKMMAMTGLDSSNALVQEMISGGPSKYAAALNEIVSSEENAQKFREAADEYGTSLTNQLGTTLTDGKAQASQGGQELATAAGEGIATGGQEATATAQSVDQQTVEQFGSHYGEASDAGRNLTGGFGDGVAAADMVALAVTKAQTVLQQVIAAFNGGDGYAQAYSAGANVGGGYGDGLSSAIANATSVASSAMAQVVAALNGGTGYIEAMSAGANLMGGYMDGLSSVVSSAVSVASSCMEQVVGALGSGDSGAYSVGSGMMGSFTSGLSSGVGAAQQVGTSAARQVQSGLGSNYWGANSAGRNEMGGFTDGLRSASSSVYSIGREAAVQAQNGVGSNYWGAYDAGKNFTYGFADGIESVAYVAYNRAQNIADECVRTINSALNEHSPSRVTRQTGRYFSLGLALGIEDEAESAYSEVSDMATGIVDALDVTKEVAKLGSSIGEGFGSAITSNVDFSALTDTASLSRAVSTQANAWSAAPSRSRAVSHGVSPAETDNASMAQTIASAVAQGMVSVQMANSTAGTPDTTIVLRVGNEDLARAVAKGNDSLARRGVVKLS